MITTIILLISVTVLAFRVYSLEGRVSEQKDEIEYLEDLLQKWLEGNKKEHE